MTVRSTRLNRTILQPLLWGIVLWAATLSLWADTCSYTYHCSGPQCAAVMGGYSGTRSQSGITFEQCEAARKAAIPSGSSPCTCTAGGASGTAGSGPQVAVGHNLQQNMVSLGANMMVSNIKNPYVGQFMSSFTNSFLQTVFDNQAEAERQRQIMDQQLAEQRRIAEERRRIAEQQRIDAMFARLNQQLKLEGLPFGLTLKAMNSNTDLELKGMNSSRPEDLKLKLGPSTATSYGLKGLPGIYVGGPAGSDATSGDGAAGSSGNPNLASGPGTGRTGEGIPGLPGIYLDGVRPDQAAQLAQAADNLSGQEKTVAQDTALEAAQRNPALTSPSEDPKVQAFQQAAQQYDQAADAAKTAQQGWTDAQSRAEGDKSLVEMARTKLDTANATASQQEAFNKMLDAAHSDEDAAAAAQKIFDGANATLAISRTNAATTLGALAPASGASSNLKVAANSPARTPTYPASSAAVDLSHTRSTTPAILTSATPGGAPIVAVPVRAENPAPKPASVPVQDLGACLASAAGHPLPADAALPTPEQLREQLQDAQEAIHRLVEDHETQEDLREDATEQINDAVHDAKKQAFDLTVDFVMHKAIVGVRSGIWQSGREVEDLQKLAASEADPAKLTALRSQIAQASTRNDNLKLAKEILEKGKDKLEERARLRDFREWTAKPEELEQTKGQMEGVKQLIQAALSEKKVKAALLYTPYVDSIVKWGSSLVDTTYDLAEEYVSAKEIDQYNSNSVQYLKAVESLNRRVKASVAQLNCYKGGPSEPSRPHNEMTAIQPN